MRSFKLLGRSLMERASCGSGLRGAGLYVLRAWLARSHRLSAERCLVWVACARARGAASYD